MMLCVVGLGYVGLPSAAIFASKGFNVLGVDIDAEKVEMVKRGVSYLKEPGLDKLIVRVISDGRLRATTNIDEALESCNVVLIDVPTPVKAGIIDLSYVTDVSKAIARRLRRDMLIVVESTVPPGTTNGLVRHILEKGSGLRADKDFYLAHVPERIVPGKAIEELLHVFRIAGGVGPYSTEKALEIYSKVNSNLLPTDATTAEFVKLIENTFRDLNIAFANLIALIAEELGIDVYEAIRLANTHPRVNIHMPGAGVGDPCLTKDPHMLASLFGEFWGTELIKLARRINEYMPSHMVGLVEKALGENGVELRGARVAVLGAAYKGGVDDTRESPSRRVVKELLEIGLDVVVYDPYTPESFGAKRVDSLENAVGNADAIVIVTDHPEFKTIDLDMLSKTMRNRIIIDGRRVIDPYRACESGFKYYGIGFGRMFKL
ncbi:MAG: nucleotide sugar dehydrogenase [Thermoproteota archaeon]